MVKNNAKCFTLIEILIVAGIIAVLSGTSLALFASYKDDKALENQATTFTSILELAKNKATSSDVSLCSNSADAHVAGYTVVVNASNITLQPECDTIPTPVIYNITSHIEFNPVSFSLRFNSQNYQGDTMTIILKNTETDKCKYVRITESGLITNKDIACI